MSRALLNPNQRRRVGTHLRLLDADLAEVAGWPEIGRPGDPYAGIRASIDALRKAVDELRTVLALPSQQGPPLRRRVMAVAEVWATDMDDLRAAQLRGYGEVHADLATVLDPRVEEIGRGLRALSDLAAMLPDR